MSDFIGDKRQYALSFTHQNFAYILGGISEYNIPLNDFYRYNSLDDSWQKLDSFPGFARWSAASAVNNNSAYVFGGTTLTSCLNDAWEFDFNSETWENLPVIPAIGKRDQICFSLGEKIYLSTGFSTNPLTFPSESYSFNKQTGIWSQEDNFPSNPIGYGTATYSGNRAIILGGFKENNIFSDEVRQFDGNNWLQLQTCLSIGTRGMSAFSIDNKFYFLTGKKADLTLSKDFYALNFTDENEVLIFPNPSEEKTNFSVQIGSKMEVYNSLGENVTQFEFNFNNNFSYTFEKSGIYFTKITFPNGEIQTKKIVIL